MIDKKVVKGVQWNEGLLKSPSFCLIEQTGAKQNTIAPTSRRKEFYRTN